MALVGTGRPAKVKPTTISYCLFCNSALSSGALDRHVKLCIQTLKRRKADLPKSFAVVQPVIE